MVEPLLVGARETARVLGISVRTLRDLSARGELPVVRIGRRTLFARESLRRFIEEHERRMGHRSN